MFDVIPEIRPLLALDRLNDLGPGSPNLAVRAQLQELQNILPAKAKNRDFALACLAGLWLYHDFLDESHAISQDLDTIEGSYWHAILHRREPDYWNAKYWFRRVGEHPIFASLRAEAVKLAAGRMWPTFLATQATWDAAAFVDLCEAAPRGPEALAMLYRRIQKREWELLFAFCYETAF